MQHISYKPLFSNIKNKRLSPAQKAEARYWINQYPLATQMHALTFYEVVSDTEVIGREETYRRGNLIRSYFLGLISHLDDAYLRAKRYNVTVSEAQNEQISHFQNLGTWLTTPTHHCLEIAIKVFTKKIRLHPKQRIGQHNSHRGKNIFHTKKKAVA